MYKGLVTEVLKDSEKEDGTIAELTKKLHFFNLNL